GGAGCSLGNGGGAGCSLGNGGGAARSLGNGGGAARSLGNGGGLPSSDGFSLFSCALGGSDANRRAGKKMNAGFECLHSNAPPSGERRCTRSCSSCGVDTA